MEGINFPLATLYVRSAEQELSVCWYRSRQTCQNSKYPISPEKSFTFFLNSQNDFVLFLFLFYSYAFHRKINLYLHSNFSDFLSHFRLSTWLICVWHDNQDFLAISLFSKNHLGDKSSDGPYQQVFLERHRIIKQAKTSPKPLTEISCNAFSCK